MVVYQVNLSINAVIFARFKAWLEKHVAEMLEFSGFIEAKILTTRDEDEQGSTNQRKKLIVQYHIQSIKHLEDYLNLHAFTMRQKALDEFGGQFSAERYIFDVETALK